jgi:hypothetical protein
MNTQSLQSPHTAAETILQCSLAQVALNLSAFVSSGYLGSSLIIFGGSPSVNGSASTAVQVALSPGGSEGSQGSARTRTRTRTRLLLSSNQSQSQSVEVVLSNPSPLHYVDPPPEYVDPPPEYVTVRCTPTTQTADYLVSGRC